jgi:hypothetical protein
MGMEEKNMADPRGLDSGSLSDLTFPESGWTIEDLSRALASETPAPRPRFEKLRTENPAEAATAFTLKEAHAYEWIEVASVRRPGFTIVVYQAGPGYLVRRKYAEGDLLHLRVCGNRVDVCRYLLERMNVPFFAKVVWSFLGKVA